MNKRNVLKGLIVGLLLLPMHVLAGSYSESKLLAEFIDEMVAEEGFNKTDLQALFTQIEKKQSILDAISRPAEKTLTWGQYRKIFLKPGRIEGGAEFWRENQQALTDAEAKYGVPAEIIVSIIGVETLYGGNTGSYRVMDALSTLAFDYPKRAPFFRSELKHFLILSRDQGQDPLSLKGSYAGAMGLGQFMPSSYRAYAADYDQDGFIDIWTNRSDAIWSVANYLSRHGWKADEAIATRASVSDSYNADVMNGSLKPSLNLMQLAEHGVKPEMEGLAGDAMATAMALEGDEGKEFWVGLHNFYMITRYNHSKLYAMAVFQLAEEIRKSYQDQTAQ